MCVRLCAGSQGQPFPTQVRIAGCYAAPCAVLQGSSANMSIDFRAPNGATGLRPTVNAHVGSSSVAFPLPSQFHNACNHLVGSRCPLGINEDATYNFVFPISAVYPPIRVGVELSLNDQAGRPVFCTIIDVQVRRR